MCAGAGNNFGGMSQSNMNNLYGGGLYQGKGQLISGGTLYQGGEMARPGFTPGGFNNPAMGGSGYYNPAMGGTNPNPAFIQYTMQHGSRSLPPLNINDITGPIRQPGFTPGGSDDPAMGGSGYNTSFGGGAPIDPETLKPINAPFQSTYDPANAIGYTRAQLRNPIAEPEGGFGPSIYSAGPDNPNSWQYGLNEGARRTIGRLARQGKFEQAKKVYRRSGAPRGWQATRGLLMDRFQ